MSVRNVLVVGGGVTGLTTSIALAQRGVAVTLVEKSPAWSRVGHGLTVQGNALRVFKDIGVLDELLDRGFAEEGVTLFFADGREMARIVTPKTGGDDVPATLGILRADLHEVLVAKAESLGVKFRLGTKLVSFENHGDAASALLSDGTTEFWDLIVAADGIHSETRAKLGITETQASTGLGIWRAVTDRKPDMTGGMAYPPNADGAYKVGYTPISDRLCYIFLLCRPQRVENGLAGWQEMRRLMADYRGDFAFLRESLDETRFLNFQEIEWIFVEGPWHRGRVIALGEAVHAVPPLIAQGAAQCTEDALLLAEYVSQDGDLEEQLTAFHARRVPRIKGVVESSMLLADWEQHPGGPDQDPGRVMGEALAALVPAA